MAVHPPINNDFDFLSLGTSLDTAATTIAVGTTDPDITSKLRTVLADLCMAETSLEGIASTVYGAGFDGAATDAVPASLYGVVAELLSAASRIRSVSASLAERIG